MFRDEIDPFDIFRKIEKMFNSQNFGSRIESFDKFRERKNVREPLIDIQENEKQLKIIAELPGIKQEETDIRIKDKTLIISAEIKHESTNKDKNQTIHTERTYQKYYRTIPLPENVNTKKISAKYNNGILEIIVPKLKTEKKKSGEKIKIEYL